MIQMNTPGGCHVADQDQELRALNPTHNGAGRRRARVDTQREIYGEPIGDRARRLIETLGINQARLAEVLGISPPMLCQLISAHRVRIKNPQALGRLVLLERILRGNRPTTATEIDALLKHVKDSRPHTIMPEANTSDRTTVLHLLRAVATPADLAAAANALGVAFPNLAQILRQAANTIHS
jgi:transcriptional regulator with XRE-family HTH domain